MLAALPSAAFVACNGESAPVVAHSDASDSDETIPEAGGGGSETGRMGPPCDPKLYESQPGDDGCAPRWIEGDGCAGGKVLFPCGVPSVPNDGRSAFDACAVRCMGSHEFNACRELPIDAGPDGANVGAGGGIVVCYVDHTGRRPPGLVLARSESRTVGHALAQAAHLEAASIEAFLDLAEQLSARGAPARLVRRLRRAASDEVSHARDVGALARARGADPPPVSIAPTGLRSLLELALENAREGCVRETWGAACAVAQSKRAASPDIRAAMQVIARDELRHAALSWDVATWLDARLTEEERRHVAEERARALAELGAELEASVPRALRDPLGLPTEAEARVMFASMMCGVWGEA